jgi:hypothetical protein
MLTNYYQELDDPNSRLTLKTNRNGNIQKQVSIAEQMAILFGSTMCTCYLCKMKTAKNTKRNQKKANGEQQKTKQQTTDGG